MPPDPPNPIVLYDGVCGLCNRTVQFILKRDSRDHFRFATLQSDFAKALLQKHGMDADHLETVCLVLNHDQPSEQIEVRSNAAIRIGYELGGLWRLLAQISGIFPGVVRDWGYNLVARYRYRIFGKYDTCPLPSPSQRNKFLDVR